jgi:outer membrane protein OmpA-like peptidoglycan-associated protein
MSTAAPLQIATAKPLHSVAANMLLQRKCACGSSASALTGQCEECSLEKRLGIQTKLRISEPGDALEQEADRVATSLMRMPDQPLGRPPTDNFISRVPGIQRKCAACEYDEEKLHTKPSREAPPQLDSTAETALHALGSGSPLPTTTRSFFERGLGHDFGAVRLHANTTAGRAAQSINARAFTLGRDIVFAPGEYALGTANGRHLLAHELVHVVQQAGSASENEIVRRAPADPNDRGDLAPVLDDDLTCHGKSLDGPGEVAETSTGWELRNFDVDKHFLKPEHEEGLKKTIAPARKAFIDANAGKPLHITIVGEASTTAGLLYNLRLSRRRARCVVRALEALGIPPGTLGAFALGDIAAEVRLAMKKVKTQRDIENPDDRRVTIELEVPQSEPTCTVEDKLRASDKELDVRFGCLSRNRFSVVIADRNQKPNIYRKFIWEKMFAIPTVCEFFPDLDQMQIPYPIKFQRPVRLARTVDPDAPSDFSSIVLQKSRPIPPDEVDHVLEFESNGEEMDVEFPGTWSPAACEAKLHAGNPMATVGKLKPDGPVECGPMPKAQFVDCVKPSPPEACPQDRRESTASHFKAKTEALSVKEKIVDWLGDQIVGHEVRNFNIGTIKTDAEKKTGDDIWRPYLFIGKVVYGPEGCEQRDPQESARGEAKVDDAEQLPDIPRPATLTRTANSNVEHLWILGFGTFKLLGEKCTSGNTEILAGVVTPFGNVRCEPMDMDAPPAEQTCKVDCPEARRTCADTEFLFKFGRMASETVPPVLQKQLLDLGCQAEVARVNIGTISPKPIWRPFLWIQSTHPCPFTVRSGDLFGTASKTTLGVKLELKFKWPPIGVATVNSTNGLRLAEQNPDDPAAASEFSLATALGAKNLNGSRASNSIAISGITRTYYQMATIGAPVDWTGTCQSSDTGQLIPAGKVECGLAPPPQHDPAPKDTCQPDVSTIEDNIKYFNDHKDFLNSLFGSGIITELLDRQTGFDLYHRNDTPKDVRFVGQVYYGPGNKLEPIVTVFDMKVTDIWHEKSGGDNIYLTFVVDSEPCTYRQGIEGVPLRLFHSRCEESIRKGETYTISRKGTQLKPP